MREITRGRHGGRQRRENQAEEKPESLAPQGIPAGRHWVDKIGTECWLSLAFSYTMSRYSGRYSIIKGGYIRVAELESQKKLCFRNHCMTVTCSVKIRTGNRLFGII